MFYIKTFKQNTVKLVLAIIASTGCGGAGTYWNDFEPRTATIDDISGKTFYFNWYPEGNTIDDDLGEFQLDFGDLDASGEGNFTIAEEDGGSANGTVEFDSPEIRFEVTSTTGEIGLAPGQSILNEIEADVSDGRIRLYDESREQEMTSLP